MTINHFEENWPEPRPEEREPRTTPEETEPTETFQNDRISPEVENPASPEIDVVGLADDTEDDNLSMDSDSYYSDSDNAPPGSPEGMPELDHQFSESEEPTTEKIAGRENDKEETVERTQPPVQHLGSDDESDAEEFTGVEIFQHPTVDSGLPESSLIESGLPESTEEDLLSGITVDELRDITPEELNRVLSSCELINPNDLNDASETNGEVAVNVSSKLTTQCDKNQNFIQSKAQTDSVFANDTIPQPEPMQVDEVCFNILNCFILD